MKTPSGFAHVGSLRGPIVHSLIYRALKDAGVEAKFTFVFNDFDPADEFPPELKEELQEHAGKPLKKVPSPDPKYKNLGDLLADDLKLSMQVLGVESHFLSSWDMYNKGKFDGVIREALDNAEKIQDIYQKVSGSQKREKGWLPFQVICENCGKLGTTRVYAWDGKEVSYKCEPNMVAWAKGCGHEGKISPFGGKGKLPWKVDWAAHWKVMGVTIEAAGKDHASKGGSYDIALTLCDEVFGYPRPFNFGYEFFLIGGKKMSSSKGLGLKAHDLVKIMPAELGRFAFTRNNYKEQIEFDPMGTMAIPDLFDEYDEAWQAYVKDSDENLARTFVLSQISDVPSKDPIFLSRFRDVVNYLQQPGVEIKKKFEEIKGEALAKDEKALLEERRKYAQIWLEKYAPPEAKFGVISSFRGLRTRGGLPTEFYQKLLHLIEAASGPEELEKRLYELIKEQNLSPRGVFSEIYSVLIGKTYGPKAVWLIWENRKRALEIFKKASK